MLYEPSYMQPYLTDFDIEAEDSVFSCIINAEGDTKVSAYELELYSLDNELIGSSNKVALSPDFLYDGSRLEVPNFNSAAINGDEYIWRIKIFEEQPTMFVAEGEVVNTSTDSTICIEAHYQLDNNMFLKIGEEVKQIDSFATTLGENAVYYEATLNSPLSAAPAINDPYSIYTDYIKSSEFLFRGSSTFSVLIDSFDSVIDSPEYTFSGAYFQEEGIGRKYFIWNLYDNVDNLVSTSGKITSGLIQHTFRGLKDNNSYQIELVVENLNGTLMKTTKNSFRVDYSTENIEVAAASVDNSKTAIEVSWETEVIGIEEFAIYKNSEDNYLMTYVATLDSSFSSFIDYAIKNNTSYEYFVFPKVSGSFTTPLISNTVETKWWNWALIGLNKEDEFLYKADTSNIWLFDLNLQSENLNQMVDKRPIVNFTRYDKFSLGERNFIQGGLTALLGQFDGTTFIDTVQLEKNFREFIASDCLKLLKDRKGDIYLVETIANSFKYEGQLEEQIVYTTFQFTEVKNISDVSIIE